MADSGGKEDGEGMSEPKAIHCPACNSTMMDNEVNQHHHRQFCAAALEPPSEVGRCPMCDLTAERNVLILHRCDAQGLERVRGRTDRERIEFIRRAYLARLAKERHVDELVVYDEHGKGHHGVMALRYFALQDWEAVREL